MQNTDTRSVVAANVAALLDGRPQKWLADRIGVSEMYLSRRMRGQAEWSAGDLVRISEALVTSPTELVTPAEPAREAGHAAPRILAAVALAFVIAAGLPIHAGVTLVVAVFVGWVYVGLFGAELATWAVPTGARHLAHRGRRDRTTDQPVRLGGEHCCACSVVCHHVGPLRICAAHRVQASGPNP